jgi:hypothetical protein
MSKAAVSAEFCGAAVLDELMGACESPGFGLQRHAVKAMPSATTGNPMRRSDFKHAETTI